MICVHRVNRIQVWKVRCQEVPWCTIINKWVVLICKFKVIFWIEVWVQAILCSLIKMVQHSLHNAAKETITIVCILVICQRKLTISIYTNSSQVVVTKFRVLKLCLTRNQINNLVSDTWTSLKRPKPRDAWLKWIIKLSMESKSCLTRKKNKISIARLTLLFETSQNIWIKNNWWKCSNHMARLVHANSRSSPTEQAEASDMFSSLNRRVLKMQYRLSMIRSAAIMSFQLPFILKKMKEKLRARNSPICMLETFQPIILKINFRSFSKSLDKLTLSLWTKVRLVKVS